MNNRIRINGKLYEAVGSDYYVNLLQASSDRSGHYDIDNYKNGYIVSLTKEYGSYNGAVVVIVRNFIDPDRSTTTLSIKVENGYNESLISRVGHPKKSDINNFDDMFDIVDLLHDQVDGDAAEVARLTNQGKLHVFDLIDPKVFNRVTEAITDFVDSVEDLNL